jgi:hypothetical protein
MALSNPKTPGRIFISYRRDETVFPASWLYERLAAHFGPEQVFKDVDSIELGDDFPEAIADAVGACDVLLVLIGAQWLEITDEAGRRRLENPDDFVRLEIEAALQRKVRIIPILVGRARMPRADQLPASLGKLVHRQALELDPNRFEADFRRLVRVVERTLAEEEARREAEESRLTTVQAMVASLRADGPAEADAADAALRRLAGDESEQVAQAAQAVLRVWEAEQAGRQSAGQHAIPAEPKAPRPVPPPVPPPTKVVTTDAERSAVPVETPAAAPPDPPGDTAAGARPARRRLVIAALALTGVLVAGGIAYAQFGRDKGDEGAAGPAAPIASAGPTTPADEACTAEIKNNPRWVCLTSAAIANGKITIKFEPEYAGSTPNIETGYHVHLYGGDGKKPPDYTMGSHWPKSTRGKYIYVTRSPFVLDTDDSQFATVFGRAPKVCARIAIAGHGLAHDDNGGYKTGNCVPITGRD